MQFIHKLSLIGKLTVLESISIFMLILFVAIGINSLHGELEAEGDMIDRLAIKMGILKEAERMNASFLTEVKLAKDVWLRGADPEKLKKYQREFIEQQAGFNQNAADAQKGMEQLAIRYPADWADLIKLNKAVIQQHQLVSEKYLAQIAVHTNYAESDAKVAGIDRELSKSLGRLHSDISDLVHRQFARQHEESHGQFKQRVITIVTWVLFTVLVLFALGRIINSSVRKQLGGEYLPS